MESEQPVSGEPEAAERWRTIPEFPDFVVSSLGRFAWKTGRKAGKLKYVAGRSANWNGGGSRFKVVLSRSDDGVRKDYNRSATLIFSAVWPEKPNPYT